MSAAGLVSQPQICPVITACIAVLRISKREAIAAWLKVSLDTVDRLNSDPTEYRWTQSRIKDLRHFEKTIHKTEIISAAILADAMEDEGDALEAARAVSLDISEAATEIQVDNAFLADGARDRNRAEARRVAEGSLFGQFASVRTGILAMLALALLCGCDRRSNPGAVMPIYEHVSPKWMAQRSESHGMVGGQTVASGPDAGLYFARDFDGITAHEITHYYEARLAASGNLAGVRIVRHAFRDLNAGDFEVGHNDLMTEIP